MAYAELRPEKYLRLGARELARLVASCRASPVQLAELAIARARELEPLVNAYVGLLDQYALRKARAREREARAGRLRGALHGVPIAVKDNFYLAGMPATRGSRTSVDYRPSTDSPMVERILAAGAVVVGKTTMPEFGWKGTGISPLTGVTRNPWNVALNSGGSSAGSAVTVATGTVPVALGSDAGGSVRIPAAFCGTVGLKPTLGRIPVWPGTVTELLSHAGPLTRTVDDAQLLLEVCEGPDPRDPLSYAASSGRTQREAQACLAEGRLRVGLMASPFGIVVEAPVAHGFATAVSTLRKRVKARYAEATFSVPLPRRSFETLWVTGRGLGFADAFARHAEEMDQGLVRVGQLAQGYSVRDYFDALTERRAFNAAACVLLRKHDVLVMPTMPILPFAADQEVPPGGESEAPLPWITWTPFTYPFNLSGQPAISIPCGFSPEGLPMGLQVVGNFGDDALVLAVARRFEASMKSDSWPYVAKPASHHDPVQPVHSNQEDQSCVV
jgi:aspartyl-tRNA(Asn)/glutamyl-tRNA(Gln) amidotransferase subunit A